MTGADQCSPAAVRCLIRPSRFVPEGTPGRRCCSPVSPADARTTASRTLLRKKQQHIALGLHQMAITVTHAARN